MLIHRNNCIYVCVCVYIYIYISVSMFYSFFSIDIQNKIANRFQDEDCLDRMLKQLLLYGNQNENI